MKTSSLKVCNDTLHTKAFRKRKMVCHIFKFAKHDAIKTHLAYLLDFGYWKIRRMSIEDQDKYIDFEQLQQQLQIKVV